MKRSLVFFSLIITCVSCSKNNPGSDAAFDEFKARFISEWWRANPVSATSAGYHAFDDMLPAYDAKTRNTELSFAKDQLEALHRFDPLQLNELNRIDQELIENALRAVQFYNDTFKAWQWDPSGYNVAGAFADIVNAKNLAAGDKVKFIRARLSKVPTYYAAAKENISNPTEVHRMLAIEQSSGTIAYLSQELQRFCSGANALNAETENQLGAAVKAVEDYRNFLENLHSVSPRDFHLGKALYERKFDFDIQSGYSPEQIYQKALDKKNRLHREMYYVTGTLWQKYFREPLPADTLKAIRMMIDRVSLTHAHRDSFMQEIEKQIPQLASFVRAKNLLYLDPSKPLKVRRTPAYMDGVAGASINAPGPYDKDAETYYNVSTLEKKTPEQAESYLREYNEYVLQILNIHEAIPGHYAQLVYANQSPSVIKTVFGNNAMIEGWAVYGEKMMLENNYNHSAEMQLMYDKWHLRSVCNTILDYSVHVLGWDEQQAMDLLVREAFQQDAEARGKWRRVSVTQVQLCCYFTGYTEIYDLREALKKKPGFDLKKFHEQFLSYGSAPVKSISAMMLK